MSTMRRRRSRCRVKSSLRALASPARACSIRRTVSDELLSIKSPIRHYRRTGPVLGQGECIFFWPSAAELVTRQYTRRRQRRPTPTHERALRVGSEYLVGGQASVPLVVRLPEGNKPSGLSPER